MKAIFDERQLKHNPERYFRRGAYIPHPEQPERAILIRDMLLKNGFEIEPPQDHGEEPIKAVHDPDYVDFWKDAYARWREAAGDARLAGGEQPCVPEGWAAMRQVRMRAVLVCAGADEALSG